MSFPYEHSCGLEIIDEDDENALEGPEDFTFISVGGDAGDVLIDGHDFGWYLRTDAEKVATSLGLEWGEVLREAYVPKNPRREADV